MKDGKITARVPLETIEKIEEIIKLEDTANKAAGTKARTKSDILVDAIDFLYYKKITDKKDSSIIKVTAPIIDDALKLRLKNMYSKLDALTERMNRFEMIQRLLISTYNFDEFEDEDLIDIALQPNRFEMIVDEAMIEKYYQESYKPNGN